MKKVILLSSTSAYGQCADK